MVSPEINASGHKIDRSGIREQTLVALQELSLRQDITTCDTVLRRTADLLAYMATDNPMAGRTPPMFRNVARTTCAKEIAQLRRHAKAIADLAQSVHDVTRFAAASRRLAKCVAQLHQPTILALADAGFLGGERQALRQAAEDASVNLSLTVETRNGFVIAARYAAECADRVNLSKIPERSIKGPPLNNLVRAVGDFLLKEYERLTGRRATVTSNPFRDSDIYSGAFVTLVKRVLPILGIRAGASGVARQAIARRDAALRKK